MNGLSTWLTLFVAVLSIGAIVGAAVAVFRANLAKATIETLKDNNAALDERVRILEADNARQVERISSLESENRTLRSVVTGVEELKRIRSDVERHHQQMHTEHDHIQTVLAGAHDLLTEILKRHPL